MTLSPYPNQSRPPSVPLIGREDALQALSAALQDGGACVVTGPPGVGKTRLVAHLYQARVPAGQAYWVDAAACADADALCAALAAALSIPEVPGPEGGHPAGRSAARLSRLGRGLSSRGEALLVVDDAQALSEDGVAVLRALCASAPNARIVTTSRRALSWPGARSLALAPLPVPAPGSVPEAESGAGQPSPPPGTAVPDRGAPHAVTDNPAVQLLLARATAYRFQPQDAPAVAELVRALDGLPLALELAARRLRLLTPQGLLSRMGRRLDLLRAPSAAAGSALRQVIGASYAALSEVERVVLSQCATFHGPFDVSAAEAVVSLVDGDELLVLDALDALQDHSLLQAEGEAGAPRFRMLQSIAAFALEQLDPGALVAAQRRHAEYFACAPAQTPDIPNLRAAYAFASTLPAPQDVPLQVSLLLSLDPLLAAYAPVDARLQRLDATLARSDGGDAVEAADRARLLLARGLARQRVGHMDAAEADLGRAQGLSGGHAELSCEVACQLGALHLSQGRPERARTHLDAALSQARGLRNRVLLGRVHLTLGLLAHSCGQLDAARTDYEAAADALRAGGATGLLAEALTYLGMVWLQWGRPAEARAHYDDVLRLLRPTENLRLSAMTFGNLAILDQEAGALPAAQAHLERALAAALQIGDRMLEGHLLGYRGCLCHERGDVEGAQDAYEHAIAVLREVGDIRLEAIFVACLGSLRAHRGMIDAAREAFDRAEALLAPLGDEGALAAVSMHRGQLMLAEARAQQEGKNPAVAGGAGAPAGLLQEAVRDMLQAARRDALFGASDDLRFALRLLSASLQDDVLTVTRDGDGVCGFRAPGQAPADVTKRGPLRRLLGALLAARTADPGVAVPVDALIAAAWPGEQIGYEASMNRLKVALAALRKLGLRALLVRADGGYLLDPAVDVREQQL